MSLPKRGRPAGRTDKGRAREAHLYRVALRLFAEQGYASTTLRAIARTAGVSPGLMYRYFDSKEAVVLRLYTELSSEYASQVGAEAQPWAVAVADAMDASLTVLGPHRSLLRSLTGVLVSTGDSGLFSPATSEARLRVQQAFERAILEAPDAPAPAIGRPLARLCYLGHLGLLLFWLLDRSDGQGATSRLVSGIRRLLPRARWLLRLPGAPSMLHSLDEIIWEGLLGGRLQLAMSPADPS